jgi:hypothetical protein
MKAGKKLSPCIKQYLNSNSSSRAFKNGKLISGYDATYDSDDSDDGTLDINTFGDMASVSNDEFIKNMLHRSLHERLMNDFNISVSPDDLYESKKIGIRILPIISSKYHPLFSTNKGSQQKSKKKTKRKRKGKEKGKEKGKPSRTKAAKNK